MKELLEAGVPADLYRAPGSLFTARFFCEMNEIAGTVRSGRVETPLGFFAAPGLEEGTAAVVCIRPQGVRIRPEGHCIPGRIVARRSLGEVDLFEIVVSGLEVSILARVREAGEQGPGDDIGVDVDPALIADRYQRLTALQTQIGLEENQAQEGRTLEVLVRQRGDETRTALYGDIAQRTEGPDRKLVSESLGDEVSAALDALADDYREVVEMADLGGDRYKDIASKLNVPIGTVMSRLFRARRQLESTLRGIQLGAADGDHVLDSR